MGEDLLALVLLVAVGWGRLADVRVFLRESAARAGWGASRVLRHPFYRIAVLMMVLLALGWANTLAQLGWHSLSAQLAGEPPPPPAQETERCHDYQREMSLRGIRDYSPCPFGGQLYVDAEGFFSCRRHGRPKDVKPVGRR